MRYLIIAAIAMILAAIPAAAARELSLSQADLKSGNWKKALTSDDAVAVVVDAAVAELPDYAFADCWQIVSFAAAPGSKLAKIGNYAFLGCENMRSAEIPASVTSIGTAAFRECTALEYIAIPARVATIPAQCFQWCGSLKSVLLPRTLKVIKRAAFQHCTALQTIDLHAGITEIGSNAFNRCTSLTEIRFPDSVRELGSYVVSDCSALRSAVLPANNALLGELMFSGCTAIESITVLSPTPPPFDCLSFIFEPDETALYKSCRLIVKAAAIPKYRKAHGWNMFGDIVAE